MVPVLVLYLTLIFFPILAVMQNVGLTDNKPKMW